MLANSFSLWSAEGRLSITRTARVTRAVAAGGAVVAEGVMPDASCVARAASSMQSSSQDVFAEPRSPAHACAPMEDVAAKGGNRSGRKSVLGPRNAAVGCNTFEERGIVRERNASIALPVFV